MRRRAAAVAAASLLGCALTACDPADSALEPFGPAAARITELWWFLFWAGTAVFIVVLGLLLYAHLPRRTRRNRGEPPGGDTRFIVIGGAVVPAVILLAVLVPTIRTGSAIAPVPADAEPLIEVIGHQFWWEVRYPDQGVVTANEIHIPAGQPVELRLLSRDVIHSFWVPALAGKLDMTPGRVVRSWIQADEPGIYRGQCAEYCGVQHALMALLVIAQPRDEFERWLAHRRTAAAEPAEPWAQRGQDVFFEADCHLCHAIAGVADPGAAGSPGPDLTHFGSRLTIGSAILENNRGNLAGWLLNPQHSKPGNRMPPTLLDPESLHALVAYLESLR